MTNYERWKTYFRGIHAPLQFVEAGFYFTISAALERRIWLSDSAQRIYANQYVLLCGPAGVGKGLVTSVVDEVLRHHKRADAGNANKPEIEKETVIRFGPVSGSYQRLVQRMAERTDVTTFSENGNLKPYAYSSAVCILDEFTSWFTENANEAVTFFLSVWGGSVPYERDTKSSGRLFIANPSLSMIAGTTPSNLQRLQKVDVIGTGLDRRMLIIYAGDNEYRQIMIPKRTPEQVAALDAIKAHVLALTKVCGGLTYTDEAIEKLQTWWLNPKVCNVSRHPKLQAYHPNKNVLLHKLAIAIHMADGTPAEQLRTPIGTETVQRAIQMLSSYERLRSGAWSEVGANMLYTLSMRIHKWLCEYGTQDREHIQHNWRPEGTDAEIDQALQYLTSSGRAIFNLTDGNKLTYTPVNDKTI